MEATLSGLASRVFLLNNVHDDQPVLFQSRWALSYLRGPLTRTQIETLMTPRKAREASPTAAAESNSPTPMPPQPGGQTPLSTTERPVAPPAAKECYIAISQKAKPGARLLYRPAVLANAKLHFANAKSRVDSWEGVSLLSPLGSQDASFSWESAQAIPTPSLADDAQTDAAFSEPPAVALQNGNYALWSKMLASHLYQNHALHLWHSPDCKAYSHPGEIDGDFRARLGQDAREARDLDAEKLRKRYGAKITTLQNRIRRAEQKVEVEESQYKDKKIHTALSFGATLVGALFSRRKLTVGNVGRASSAMRNAGRVSKEKEDIGRAKDSLDALREQLQEMENTFQSEVDQLTAPLAPGDIPVEEYLVRPRKSDIAVQDVRLAWTPWSVDADGIAEPLF